MIFLSSSDRDGTFLKSKMSEYLGESRCGSACVNAANLDQLKSLTELSRTILGDVMISMCWLFLPSFLAHVCSVHVMFKDIIDHLKCSLHCKV